MLVQKKPSLLLLAIFLLPIGSFAQSGMGLGGYLQFGNSHEMGGLVGKIWLGPTTSLDLTLSVDFDEEDRSLGIYGGYYHHYFNMIKVPVGKMPLYHGPIGGLGIWNGGIALRGGWTFGLAYVFSPEVAPFDIFLQADPNFEYLQIENGDDRAELDVYIKLGFRFFFGR